MISLEWVSDYIDIKDEDLKELAVKITQAGINVENVISNHIDHLVIGKVISAEDHPDSDHLHVCMVDVGLDQPYQIVCGAPNVRAGLKVIVALVGAVLPGDFEIKKSVIRGQESNGMLCALYELGLEEKNDETYAKGIYEVDDDAPIGVDALKYLGYDTTLYELDIHKHRNNDCYYHIGFAYEIAAILNKKVHLPDCSFSTSKKSIKDSFKLKVDTDKCPYYLARMVQNVHIGPSPLFMKRRLEAAGMRSINNVVDISNYVMLEFGQPLHFFDKDKLGDFICVRNAYDEEKIVTLDDKERILTQNDIVISDGDKAVAIAGVMGGKDTDVDDNTTSILIESAIFDAVSVRNTANKLHLKSEASIRYGKGLSYEYTEQAINRACHLLEKYAGATILNDTVSYDIIDKSEKTVVFKASDVNKMLGIEIDTKDMEYELNRLDFPYELKDNTFSVTIPKRRLDIDPNVNDIAEEIGRLYGYQNLQSTLLKSEIKKGEYIGDVKYRKFISKRLRSLGLNETKTYTLVSPSMAKMFCYEQKEHVVLPNPMSVDKSVVRTSLLPSLWNVYLYNQARKVDDIMLYEISKTYDASYQEESKIALLLRGNYLSSSWKGSVSVDFYLVKGIVEDLLCSLGLHNRYSFEKKEISDLHPGVSASILLDRHEIGIIGKVHPNITNDDVYVVELSLQKLMVPIKNIKFKEAFKYPNIEKDMAFILDKNIMANEVIAIIKKKGGRLLQDINVFDVYEGDHLPSGKKSLAFHLVFGAEDRTLLDDEVMNIFNQIILEIENNLHAELRDK